jgi:lipopolysaccharide/colanic/teichoic acid biosynthesis glycosyltransferase
MKRFFDVVFTLVALIVLSIPMLIAIILVYIRLGSPIFFIQNRPGLHGKPFKMIKLRTMTNDSASDGVVLPDSLRITPFGAFLRSTSMDELPELWNVLRGEMSIVGPRPLLMEYLPLYSPDQSRRHSVRPGITGWAQINGRNSIGWEERLRLDQWYVDNQSLRLDMIILWLTVKKVLMRDGISADGNVTMPKFTGRDFDV